MKLDGELVSRSLTDYLLIEIIRTVTVLNESNFLGRFLTF